MTMAASLVRYDAACRALAEAKSVDEVKDLRDKAEAMRAYGRQAKNKQLEIDASEIRFRAERRIGELIAEQGRAGGLANGGDAMRARVQNGPEVVRPTLADAGIDKHLADRSRKLAAIPEEKFETILADRRDRIEQENARVTVNLLDAADNKHVRGTFGTGENEWYTPAEFIEAARHVLGEIDLDPASSAHAQQTVQSAQFFTEETDGLARDWIGRVWLNPPYAQPHIANFAAKMIEQRLAGNVEAAIMLTHNYTDTSWFQGLALAADAICFTRGRIRFVDPEGGLAAPTQGQAFFYFGADVDRFAERFASIGFVVRPLTGEVADDD